MTPCATCRRRLVAIHGRQCGVCLRARSAPPRAADADRYIARESTAHVEWLLAQATAARQARERLHGRTHTITDGWAQKPGRSTLDGECRLTELS